MQRHFAALLTACALVAVAGCGSSGSTNAKSGAASTSDQIYNYAFIPASPTVRVGARVVFANHDATSHTATDTGGKFDTGTIKPGESRTVTLSKPGRYSFYCQFHAFMRGTITVTG